MSTATFTITDPRQLALNTATGDILLVNGRFSFISGREAIAQDIVVRLRLFLNEWFLNLDAGVDWWSYLGEKFTNTNEVALHSEIERVVTEAPGVESITKLSLTLDPVTRGLSISFTAPTAFGDVDISTSVNP